MKPPAFMLLKTVPPKMGSGVVHRERLSWERFRLAGLQIIEVSAPHGFGKSTLLSQWHREATEAGVVSMWLGLDERDDASRLIQGLTYAALRSARPNILPPAFSRSIGTIANPQEALTAWLAEIAESQHEMLLLLDDVDHLSRPARSGVIDYLLANVPGNLSIALSSRPDHSISDSGILDSAPMVRVTAKELRLRDTETMAIVRSSLGQDSSPDVAVRIQAATDGWPLGVRLAAAAQLRAEPANVLDDVNYPDLGRYFFNRVLCGLDDTTRSMLAGLADIDPIHPDLCIAIFGRDAPVSELERLADESPVLSRSGNGGWLRLHAAARDVLADVTKALPAAVRRAAAEIACRWYNDRGMPEEAARQADLAGDPETAIQLAESSVRQMTAEGRSGEVLEWFRRMSAAEVSLRPGFWASAAWTLAMSDRHDDALQLIENIFKRSDLPESERFEAHLIVATMAGYTDDLGKLQAFAAQWLKPPVGVSASEAAIHATCLANAKLLDGHPDQARFCWAGIASRAPDFSPVSWGFAELSLGLSHLWEGRPLIAYEGLHQALARAEGRMDRWNRVVSMIAAALARACVDIGRLDEARLHLALRLPILEKYGLPDTLMAAYSALAEIADDAGRQDQAQAHLESLASLGRARGVVRMEASALCELAFLHGRHGRASTALRIADNLDDLLEQARDGVAAGTTRSIRLYALLARTASLLATSGREAVTSAETSAAAADQLATEMGRGGDALRARVMRGQARALLGRSGADAMLDEATSLLSAAHLLRLVEMHRRSPPPPDQTATASDVPDRHGFVPDMTSILTQREHDVLQGLVDHLSNKEIASAMDVGEETIKWHLKNLYHKLAASDRKHAVGRAKAMGIL